VNCNLVSSHKEQIVVDGQESEDGQEDGGGAAEVPDVVVVVKVEVRALHVQVPRFGCGSRAVDGVLGSSIIRISISAEIFFRKKILQLLDEFALDNNRNILFSVS
jgi:hypothetical protein